MSEQSEIIFQRLFKTLKVEQAIEDILDGTLSAIGDTSDEEKQMAERIKKFILSEEIIGPIFDEYIRLLGANFTPEEANTVVKWNMSPVGKKWQEKIPKINAELNKKMFAIITPKIAEEINKLMDEFDNEEPS